MWKAGHILIKAKMKEEGALLAGEMSGHIFFADRWFGFDDGDLRVGAAARAALAHTAPLSSLLADVPRTFATPELHFDCPEEKKFERGAAAAGLLRREATRRSTVDGVRVTFPDGWGLVRASNTQPMLVLRFEATSAARLARDPAARHREGGAARARGGRLVRRRGAAMRSLALGVDLGGTNARAAVVERDCRRDCRRRTRRRTRTAAPRRWSRRSRTSSWRRWRGRAAPRPASGGWGWGSLASVSDAPAWC